MEAIEKLNTFIATRTTIARNVLTIAAIAMWAAIKGISHFKNLIHIVTDIAIPEKFVKLLNKLLILRK